MLKAQVSVWLKSCFICLLSFVFCLPNGASAHGTGQTFENKAGKYTVALEYDPTDLNVGQSVVFSFELWDEDKKDETPFSNVWVNIGRKGETLFAGSIANSIPGRSTLSYAFPKEGEYEISLRFEKDDKTLAEISYPVKIEMDKESMKFKMPIEGIIGILIGLIIGGGGVLLIKQIPHGRSKKEK